MSRGGNGGKRTESFSVVMRATSSGAGKGIFDFRSVEAVMIGKGSLVDDFSS